MSLDATVLLGAKVLGLFGLGLYVIFAAVVLRQVGQMTDTLEVGFEGPIRLAAWLHFLLAIGTWVIAFVIL